MKFSKIIIVLCVSLMAAREVAAEKFITRWTLEENQLNIREGGRANSIAVHPAIASQIFVASDSGGLFRSDNNGETWRHIDKLPVIFTQSVIFQRLSPPTLFVTAKADFRATNGGGVWRSTNGGEDWQQLTLTVPNFTGRLSAYGISSNGVIAVATSKGVFVSSNDGDSWTYHDVFPASTDKRVFSVLVTGNRIYAGGPSGVRVSAHSPISWTTPSSGTGDAGVHDIHAFARTALSDSQAFLVNDARQLFWTQNDGATWAEIVTAPLGPGNCDGIAFVKTNFSSHPTTPTLIINYGNRCEMHRLVAPVSGTTPNFAAQWRQVTIDRRGTRDFAQLHSLPVLIATNAGVHRPSRDGSTYTLTGGGRLGGYNALQVNEIDGQHIDIPGNARETDLYASTQDNGLWAFNVWGNIWRSRPGHGFHLEAQRVVTDEAHAKLTYVACVGACDNRVADRQLANATSWNDPPASNATPSILRRETYVQGVRASTSLAAGLALTENGGATWQQFAAFPQERRDLPRAGSTRTTDPLIERDIVYQPFRTTELGPQWSDSERLIRVHRRRFTSLPGTVFFPAMGNFGALGVVPTLFPWYQVYAVDPGNPFHLIAPDVVNRRMMQSRNGGETWTEIAGLTSLVTDGGLKPFTTNFIEGRDQVFPIVTAISFFPEDSRMVLLGTYDGGVFASNDNGDSWRKLPDTEKATFITGFFWKSANTVFVSTFGRGIWKLENKRIAIPDAFDELCGTACEVVSMDGGGRPAFEGSVITFDGSITGVRTEGGVLREVFITPGASVVFTGDQEDPQDDILITESDGKTTGEPLPQGPDGWIAKAVVFTKGDVLAGAAYGETPTDLLPPPSKEDYDGSTDSPTAGRPYVTLVTSSFAGIAAAAPNETITAEVTDVIAGAQYEVLIDGEPVKEVFNADGNGAFAAKLAAPAGVGYHRVEVRAAGDADVLDGTTLLVTHVEGKE